jgi:hypothetical protein
VISAEYLPNLNAKYSIRPSVSMIEISERVNRNLFYFLCRVDTPTICRAVIGHILGVFGQLFDECRFEFIYNCDFAACLLKWLLVANSHMHVDALLGQDSWSAEQHNECLGRIFGRCKLGLKE